MGNTCCSDNCLSAKYNKNFGGEAPQKESKEMKELLERAKQDEEKIVKLQAHIRGRSVRSKNPIKGSKKDSQRRAQRDISAPEAAVQLPQMPPISNPATEKTEQKLGPF